MADKRLQPHHFKAARWDTAVGAVVTQRVMAAALVAAPATLAAHHVGGTLQTVGDLSTALTPFLGVGIGKMVIAVTGATCLLGVFGGLSSIGIV